MNRPNLCRNIMIIIVMTGLIMAYVSGMISGVNPMPPFFVLGAIVAFALGNLIM